MSGPHDDKKLDLRGVDPPGTPKDPKSLTLGGRLARLLIALVIAAVLAMAIVYSFRIGRFPWQWTAEDFAGFLTFSRERVESATDKVQEVDWSNLKTRVTEKTKELWEGSPLVEKKVDERIARTRMRGVEPSAQPASARGPGAYEDGLGKMREGIGHYRKSPDDPAELLLAKKSFEEARTALEKAVKDESDATRRQDAAHTLDECNSYLEDCRKREKD